MYCLVYFPKEHGNSLSKSDLFSTVDIKNCTIKCYSKYFLYLSTSIYITLITIVISIISIVFVN